MHSSDLKKEVEHPYLTNKQISPDKMLPKCTMVFWKKEVEHPFLTKREMCSRDELDSSRFHHNAPTGSLPNRPTTIVLSIFFFC